MTNAHIDKWQEVALGVASSKLGLCVHFKVRIQ